MGNREMVPAVIADGAFGFQHPCPVAYNCLYILFQSIHTQANSKTDTLIYIYISKNKSLQEDGFFPLILKIILFIIIVYKIGGHICGCQRITL